MDVRGMRERVRQVLQDDQATFISDDAILGWLNDAQVDLASRIEVIQKETVGGTFSNALGQLALPTDYMQVDTLSIAYDSNDPYVTWVADVVFDDYKQQALTPATRLGRVYATNIEVYPAPNNGTAYTLRYWRLPTTLVNEADVSELPVQLHTRLVNYARAEGLRLCSQNTQADTFLAMYERGLPGPSVGRERFLPGAMNLVPTPGPFD